MLMVAAADLPADFVLPEPPGRFVGESLPSGSGAGFRAGQPLIATSYFYWYDSSSGAHLLDHDGTDALTDHPPTLVDFSYLSVDWHARQLNDMIEAGIDVALPVYWGTPLGDHGFSDAGLPKLVEARHRLLKAGKKPPAIGMFYDTSSLQYNARGYHVDLTTEAGRQWFYGSIRNCFSSLPPADRALIDGKPLVILYAAAFAKDVDESLFPAVRAMFRRDFGSDLYLVKMDGWPGEADSCYQWGGALRPQILETAGLGPGYDHSAVPGRQPLVRSRDEGRFYEFSWQRLLKMDPRSRPWLVHLETWNEFHEGTELCETAEYGRQYIEATRRFADQFHAGRQLDPAQLAPSRSAISTTPGASDGLQVLDAAAGDGPIETRTVAQRQALVTLTNRHSPHARYMYFDVEDYFLYDADATVEVAVTYLDQGPQQFLVEYDSSDPQQSGLRQQFQGTSPVAITGSGGWRETTFRLTHARFANRANGADFRLTSLGGQLAVAAVSVRLVR